MGLDVNGLPKNSTGYKLTLATRYQNQKYFMLELGYLTDMKRKIKAVVTPIEIWERLFTGDESSIGDMTESMEDYALGKAMDEAKETPLLDREEAVAYLDA